VTQSPGVRKFAFLVHPLSAETRSLARLDPEGRLRRDWNHNVLQFCWQLHETLKSNEAAGPYDESRTRVVDNMHGLVSAAGATAEGRLIEIPLEPQQIIEDPERALRLMEEGVDRAAEWGAQIVGLGSMTGIIGGGGLHLAERGPLPVTTGNSLTVYAALQNVYQAASIAEIDLTKTTVAVIGVPGSIASAAASMLAPQCGELLLVARQPSTRASRLARDLGAELLLDIPSALARARIIVTATSTGNCIDQGALRPGSIVVDVGVPTDVCPDKQQRDEVLILSGGLTRVPRTMSLDSGYLWFHRGMIPSCLGETMVLALEGKLECFSLGRQLQIDRIEQIGELARKHGFDFERLSTWGHPLEDSAVVEYRKAAARRYATDNGARRSPGEPRATVDLVSLAGRAAESHARHVNPVLMALSGESGLVKTFVRGTGNYLWDAQGRQYLDFVAGFGALNLGHNHPAVVEAIQRALTQQAPGFAQSAVNPYAANLAEQLAILTPPHLQMVSFANSGTEAVEAALKLARKATGRTSLVYCDGSYHGKSLGSLSVTGNANYQRPFGPLLPDCVAVPYGNPAALEQAIGNRRAAAFIVEPIQAEGGMIVPPAGYLREAQALCRASGTLLVVDEVQTGLGRTGDMFAVQYEGVEPDVLTLAKSLGGGLMPIGAMICRREHWHAAYGSIESFALHTSTFGGGSLACAAALAALAAIVDERLIENAEARGRQLMQGLVKLCQTNKSLREVRGRGLLLGLEFNPLPAALLSHSTSSEGSNLARYLVPGQDRALESIPALYAMQTMLLEHGIYTQIARSNPRVLRIQPPLTITEEEVDRFLLALNASCLEIELAHHLFDGLIAKTGSGQHQGSARATPAVRPWIPDIIIQPHD
jgi:acetylornithine/succinyldiaminopimelate/putrescine aminotransferase/predicted amino acid dehydrogenase